MYLIDSETKFITKDDISFLPRILYKYRTWSKQEHKNLLINCEIHFSSPSELDENTECILESNYSAVNETMILEFCLNSAWEQFVDGNIKFNELIDKTREFYALNTFHDLSLRPHKEQYFKDTLNERISIFCASETALNERLWNTFAHHKQGYCVGIDFSEIYLDQEIFGMCQRVEYYDENNPPLLPALSLSESDGVKKMLKIIYSLPDRFKEESEFRLHKTHIKSKTVALKSEWIKEVILGSEMSEKDKNEVISIVKNKYPHAVIKRLFVEPTFGYMSLVDY